MFGKVVLVFGVAVFLTILACGGNGTDPDPDMGTLVVLSDPDGAFVYIDGALKTASTPASFELEAKSYNIKAAKLGWSATPESLVIAVAKDQTDTAYFELTPASDTAYFDVDANYSFASIFIDGVPTGQYTPAVIAVPSGSHSVSIDGWAFEGPFSMSANAAAGETTAVDLVLEFGPRVLIEEFSHVNCTNCPDAAEAVHTVSGNFSGAAIAIEWHPQQSGGTDPFHAANPAIHDGRVSYYGFVGIPRVFVAGKMVADPTSVAAIAAFVNSYLSPTNDAAKINLWGVVQSGNVHLGIIARGISAEGVIKVAVVEKHRNYATAPGINGMKDFYNVPMVLYTHPSSGTITLSDGVAQYLDFTEINIPTGGTPSDYSYVVWFQRDSDGVYSAGEEILCSPGILDF